jgi:outer membrane protein assembly factor BamA
VEKGLSQLKENLSQKGYTLSAVKTVPKPEDRLEELPLDFVKKIFSTSEEGVDFRI